MVTTSTQRSPETAHFDRAHAAQLGGYDPATAAHIVEEFLEMRLSYDAFREWLMCYPPHYGVESADPAVEDEIDRSTLSLLAFQHGTRSWRQVAAELRDARAHLSGLARI
jgi:hypothetical protein